MLRLISSECSSVLFQPLWQTIRATALLIINATAVPVFVFTSQWLMRRCIVVQPQNTAVSLLKDIKVSIYLFNAVLHFRRGCPVAFPQTGHVVSKRSSLSQRSKKIYNNTHQFELLDVTVTNVSARRSVYKLPPRISIAPLTVTAWLPQAAAAWEGSKRWMENMCMVKWA